MIDSVKIGHAVYTVHEDRDEHLNDINALGEINYRRQEIYIKSQDIGKERRDLVLAHEIAHALIYESGLDGYEDEAKIQQLAPFVLSLIKDNKFDFGNSCR